MLQLFKNQVITTATKRQVEIRQLELEWYTNNLWTLSQQGALLAGFAFSQLTTEIPSGVPYKLESAYVLSTALAMGTQMCVVVIATLCCMWGPGLALRGAKNPILFGTHFSQALKAPVVYTQRLMRSSASRDMCWDCS
eukprot:GHVO01009246.1.p1 GENE.GHVO01009246.1~~GHVO01009246.1.p1  ORF type:complete len:138 (+),score=6.81 GHVO01009246.1:120-533(+)